MSEMIAATAPDQPTLVDRGLWSVLRRRVTFWAPVAVLAVLGLIALLPGPIAMLFGGGDPRACDLVDSALPPGPGHPFGTDLQGCDIYANVVFGTRTSLSIGLLTTALCLVVAIVLGTIAGYAGGILDTVISRLTDVFLGFPFILGAIIVLNSLGKPDPVLVSLVLAFFSWPTMARLVRGAVRSVRGNDYVRAASVIGLSHVQIVVRHVLPNAIGPVLAIAATFVGSVIVAESTLTFLGVGLRAPTISWGLQLANAQSYVGTAPHMLLFPALFLSITVLALITLGDTVRDALDPKGH